MTIENVLRCGALTVLLRLCTSLLRKDSRIAR